MPIAESRIYSPLLNNARRVWLQLPPGDQPARAICIFLDGEYYVERMDAPTVIDEFQRSQVVSPFAVAYISHVDGPTRWTESKCNDEFARFVGEELVPWVRTQLGHGDTPLPIFLGGLSLTGLAAAHAVLRFPDKYCGVLCQSASFWWSNQRLVDEFAEHGFVPVPFRISCGALETTEYVEHGPDLIQRTSQVASNRAMRDALLKNGCDVSYDEYPGGHDIASWKVDLPRSLLALLSTRPRG